MSKHLTDKVEGYLNKEAKEALDKLLNLGMDKDLAISLLEVSCKDKEIYSIEDEVE